MGYEFLRDPEEIERRSFAEIRALTELGRFDEFQRQVAMRLVHTSGEPSIVDNLLFSDGAVTRGIRSLKEGATILCDVEMLRHGISPTYCKGKKLCFLNRSDVAARASRESTTRSMAAVDHWREHLESSLAVIGNAPTALFRLLELVEDGLPRPALVIGMPVGFVGAEESKQALAEHGPRLGLDYITLRGRRGGSALAAATLNALGRLAAGVHV